MGISIVTLSHYEQNVAERIENITADCSALLEAHADHPVFGDKLFQEKLLADLPRMVNTLAAVEAMYAANPISCVLAGTTEDLIGRSLVLVGSSLGIPSVCCSTESLWEKKPSCLYLPPSRRYTAAMSGIGM